MGRYVGKLFRGDDAYVVEAIVFEDPNHDFLRVIDWQGNVVEGKPNEVLKKVYNLYGHRVYRDVLLSYAYWVAKEAGSNAPTSGVKDDEGPGGHKTANSPVVAAFVGLIVLSLFMMIVLLGVVAYRAIVGCGP